jgi:hypothetical protein
MRVILYVRSLVPCRRRPCTSLSSALLLGRFLVQSLFDGTQLKSPAIIISVDTWGSSAINSVLKNSSSFVLFEDPEGAWIFRLQIVPWYATIPRPEGMRSILCSGNFTLASMAVPRSDVPMFTWDWYLLKLILLPGRPPVSGQCPPHVFVGNLEVSAVWSQRWACWCLRS